MEIKPTYVTFQQAKLLKEKGLNKDTLEIECNQGYDFRGSATLQHHGRHISSHLFYSAPEQWQVIEWLRVKHGIFVKDDFDRDYDFEKDKIISTKYRVYINKFTENISGYEFIFKTSLFNSPQEAYSAAFDYILTTI